VKDALRPASAPLPVRPRDGPDADEAAVRLVVRSVPRARPSQTAGEARRELLTGSFDCVTDIPVLDGDALVGVVPLEALLVADPRCSLGQLADRTFASVSADTDREHAAALAARLGTRTVAVVGEDDRFEGLIPPERLISVLFEEHEEDLARLGGSLARSSSAIAATVEEIPRRLWHRLPWLALGLAGAMLSAAIVASFEEELRAEVLLAFFLPAVVYMADAVGTQTETVVIRGMSLGVPIGRIAARELLTGMIIGTLIAAAFFAFALVVWQSTRVAAVVSLSLFVSTSLATAVAMSLPYLLARLGRDPAFGSGPLATVIQDLLSIAAYFAIAVALL
jgi:magnesium transporter